MASPFVAWPEPDTIIVVVDEELRQYKVGPSTLTLESVSRSGQGPSCISFHEKTYCLGQSNGMSVSSHRLDAQRSC